MKKILIPLLFLLSTIASAQNPLFNSVRLIASTTSQIGTIQNGHLYLSSVDGFFYFRQAGVWIKLDAFTSTLMGLAPASGGGTTNFLRADGTWAAPASTAPGGSNTYVQFNNAGSFGGDADFTFNTTGNVLTIGRLIAVPTATLAGINTGTLSGDPSSLTAGDIWNDTSSPLALRFRGRVGTSTYSFVMGGSLSNGQVPFVNSANGDLAGDADFTFSGGNTLNATNISSTSLTVSGSISGVVSSGTYTPTLTSVANLDGNTAVLCQYSRMGNAVTVSGRVSVDPTLTATSTQLGISLPIASNIGLAQEVGGTAFATSIAGQGSAIQGDAANDRAQMQWISTDVTNQVMYFIFMYLIN